MSKPEIAACLVTDAQYLAPVPPRPLVGGVMAMHVFVVQRCELHEGVTSLAPTAHRSLKSAIDWATLEAEAHEWLDMRFHKVEHPDGTIGKYESDFVDGTRQLRYYEIFEVSLE